MSEREKRGRKKKKERETYLHTYIPVIVSRENQQKGKKKEGFGPRKSTSSRVLSYCMNLSCMYCIVVGVHFFWQ